MGYETDETCGTRWTVDRWVENDLLSV